MVSSLSFLPGSPVVCLSLLSACSFCDHEAMWDHLAGPKNTAFRSGEFFGLGVIFGWVSVGFFCVLVCLGFLFLFFF